MTEAAREFHNPVRLRIGEGAFEGLGSLVAGRRCVVLTSAGMVRRGTLARVEAVIGSGGSGVAGRYTDVTPNPTIAGCTDAANALRDTSAELIVAIGGGSVLDTAKAVAAQRSPGAKAGWLSDHFRAGAPFPADFRPPAIIAIPTTAGTGSEVTMWGTVWDEKTGKKNSISHVTLYPEIALLDPSLTLSLPRETTVATAFDALSHSMEAIWNRSSNPVSDALAVRAIAAIPGHLRRVLVSPADPAARAGLLEAALLAGLASSNTRTALAHSISYPLTSELGLAHGLACSVTLPEILREVGERHPGRAKLIVDALGVATPAAAAALLYDLFRAAGAGTELTRHIATPAKLAGLRTSFIAPGRAENCLLPADQASAAALLRRAYDAIVAP